MQNENAQHDHYNDEIDLADLVRSLWDGKWLVIGVTFLATLLAVAYLMLLPAKTYTGSLPITPLSQADLEIYQEFNASQFMPITQQKLLDLFIEDLITYDGIEAAMLSLDFVKKETGERASDFLARVRRDAYYNFTVVPPSRDDEKAYRPNWTIEITTHEMLLADQVLRRAFAQAHTSVNTLLNQQFQRLSAMKKRAIHISLEDIAIAQNNAIEQYDLKLTERLAFLAEQAGIARVLDLAKDTLSSHDYTTSSAVVTAVKTKESFYLRGYIAIEKEIETLNARTSPIPFINEWVSLNAQKQALLSDKTAERAELTFAQTPIGHDDFRATTYDLASIQYTSKTKSTLVLALSIVLGGMLGIFVLLIRNAVIRKD